MRFPGERNKSLTKSTGAYAAGSPRVLDKQKSAAGPTNPNGIVSSEDTPQSNDVGGWDAFKKSKVYDVCKLLAIYCGVSRHCDLRAAC